MALRKSGRTEPSARPMADTFSGWPPSRRRSSNITVSDSSGATSADITRRSSGSAKTRKASLICRRARLRATPLRPRRAATPTCTRTPKGSCEAGTRRATKKIGPALRRMLSDPPLRKRGLIKCLRLRCWDRGIVRLSRGSSERGPEVTTAVGTGLLATSRVADRQDLAPFGTAPCKQLAPVFGGHARTESVLVCTLAPTGLIGRFHYSAFTMGWLPPENGTEGERYDSLISLQRIRLTIV
jgi:hypothetical protein